MSAAAIVIVGAGPAGVRAAEVLADAGLRPTLVDEADRCGGQIYRQPPEARRRPYAKLYGSEAERARALHETFARIAPALDYRPRTLAWDVAEGKLMIHAGGAVGRIPCSHLILATGATDRTLPLPGWTLPGVYTLGGAQVALKSQDCLIGRRVAFVGTGPLLYLVAVQYARAGATVAAVIDSGSRADQFANTLGLLAKPGVALRGVGFVAELMRRDVPVLKGAIPEAIVPTADGLAVEANGRTFACDAVGLGYGLRPETQLADLAGVPRRFDPRQQTWVPESGADGRTPAAGVYVAGDGAGILGADAAELRGARAALALLQDLGHPVDAVRARALEAGIAKWARFRAAIDGMFPVPAAALAKLPDHAVVCRCERVTVGDIRRVAALGKPEDVNRLKAFGRAGMGRCQGRFCGENAQAVLAAIAGRPVAELGVHRAQPPIKPIPLADFARVAENAEPIAKEAAQ